MRRRGLSAAASVMGLCGAAAAHDSWLVAGSAGDPGREIRVALVTGERFPVSEHAAEPQRVAAWSVVHGGRTTAVEAYRVEGLELAATIRPDGPGVHVVGLALHPNYIEIDGPAFTAYLQEERAEAALAHRRAQRKTEEAGRELYTKFAKACLEVGGASADASYQVPLGHTLEIVPLSNPCRWNAGDEIVVRVLLDGEPARGLRVSAGHEGLAPHAFAAQETTGDDGAARFKLTRGGLWFLRAHVIRPISEPAPESEHAADWESFWASITFEVAAPDPAAQAPGEAP